MSDLETGASRVQAAPISALAGGKLQAISTAGVRFGDTDQLVDAFAEVFARMAVTTPPVQSESADANVNRDDDHDRDTSLESKGQESQDKPGEQETISNTSQAAQVTEEQPILADPVVDDLQDQGEMEAPLEEVVVNETVPASENPTEEHDPERSDQHEQVDVAIVDPDAPTVETEASESVRKVETTIAAAASTESDSSRKRDPQGDKNIDAPKEQATVVQTKTETDSTEAISGREAIESTELSSENSTQSQSDGPPNRTKRQQRLSENREHRPQEATTTGERRGDTQASTAVTAGSSIAESAPPTKPSTAQPQQPVPQNAIAAVNAIQNRPARASATSTSSATSESQGTSNAIQSVETNRVDAGQRRETGGAKRNATDTTARIKLVQRVSRAFQHLGPDGGMVRLRLAPAELGSVRVEMRVDKQSVQARVVTETEAASAALREHLPDLRARLESFGMQVERIEVDTEANTEQNGLPFDREPQQRQNQRQPGNRNRLDEGRQDPPADKPSRVAVAGPTVGASLVSQGIDLKL